MTTINNAKNKTSRHSMMTMFISYNLHGKLHGECKKWHPNGQLIVSSVYKNGKLNGLCEIYQDDGQQLESNTYKNGKLHGNRVVWNNNGQTSTHSVYSDGVLHGLRTIFNGNQTCEESVYNKGVLHGICKEFYPNGQQATECTYWYGKKHGISMHWSIKGLVIIDAQYVNNELDYIDIHNLYASKSINLLRKLLTEDGTFIYSPLSFSDRKKL